MGRDAGKTFRAAGLLMCGVLAHGCGGNAYELETAPVSGVVTLDGKAVSQGTVIFSTDRGRPARGTLNQDGEFSLSTYRTNDGAVLGLHHIAVIARTSSGDDYFEASPPAGQDPFQWLVPKHYGSPATSGLEYEVRRDQENRAVLKLHSDSRPASGS